MTETACKEVGREALVQVIRSEGAALAHAARQHPALLVPRYPGWSLSDLVVHTGSVHRRTLVILRGRIQEPVPRQYPEDSLQGPGLIDWFEEGLHRMCDAFEATDPSTRVWSISEDGTVGFWLLRMALETAIHRWDADMAIGEPGGLGASLAACGIDEFARLQIPKLENVEFGSTGRVLLEGEDRPARWLVTLLPRGVEMFRAEEGVGVEGVVSGMVSDLYLTLLGRGDSRKLRQSGDPDLLRSMTEAISMIPDAKR